MRSAKIDFVWCPAKIGSSCATLTGTTNPVNVALAIGDDSGNATITAQFGPKPK